MSLTNTYLQLTAGRSLLEIKRRKLNWIGHTIRRAEGLVESDRLDWNITLS
jgi:hypothetical protein